LGANQRADVSELLEALKQVEEDLPDQSELVEAYRTKLRKVYKSLHSKWSSLDNIMLGTSLILAFTAAGYCICGDVNSNKLWVALVVVFGASCAAQNYVSMVCLSPLWAISYILYFLKNKDSLMERFIDSLSLPMVLMIVWIWCQLSDCFVQEAPYVLDSMLALILLNHLF
jgi:hypothetical protein